MAVTAHAMSSGYYATTSFTSNTDKRDVSELLDLWAHTETPFLNKLSWGPDSGATSLEWLTEHLGWGYFEANAAGASNSLSIVGATDPSGFGDAQVAKQLCEGMLCYYYQATSNANGFLLIESVSLSSTGVVKTITFEWLSGYTTSVTASGKVYLLGSVANEGSDPRADISRTRTILSNKFTILRKDVNITGSQAATDMYAVDNELRHQIRLRLLEMQREREMMLLYAASGGTARSSTEAEILNGVFGYLVGQSGDHIDTSTTTLTETAFNNMVATIWENSGTPNAFVAAPSQIRKFTGFDRARVRSTPDAKMGGFHVTKYLTDIGIEIDLVPMRKVPANLAFVLDTAKIKPRAKRGRKLILEKLGKTGDYEMWQMISEFSMEMRGYTYGQHGMFRALT